MSRIMNLCISHLKCSCHKGIFSINGWKVFAYYHRRTWFNIWALAVINQVFVAVWWRVPEKTGGTSWAGEVWGKNSRTSNRATGLQDSGIWCARDIFGYHGVALLDVECYISSFKDGLTELHFHFLFIKCCFYFGLGLGMVIVYIYIYIFYSVKPAVWHGSCSTG